MSIIYLDNAATTPIDPVVLEAMLPYLKNEYGNPSTNYAIGVKARKAKEAAREKVASLINANTEEIFFTSGATEANNWVLSAAVNDFEGIGMLTTSNIEHASVLNAIESLASDGFMTVTCDKNGVILPKMLSRRFDFMQFRKTPFVSIMMANNEVGSVNNITALTKIAHDNCCLFHTDATQALGHMRVDVKAMGVDALSASAHKIYGPKGTGFLYVRKDSALWDAVNTHRLLIGGHQERGLRAGTENIAGIVGMGAACDSTAEFLKSKGELELHRLKRELYKQLHDKTDAVSNISIGASTLPILSIRIAGIDNKQLLQLLDEEGVCVSTGSACNEGDSQPSHVLTAIGLTEKEISETIRISIGRFNNEKDIEIAAEKIMEAVKILRMF